MFYQKLLVGDRPYYVQVGAHSVFGAHRHPDLEMSYCLAGEYTLRIGDAVYRMQKGDFALVGAMVAHAYDAEHAENLSLTLEVGPNFLGEFFDAFAGCDLSEPVLRPPVGSALHTLLEETAVLFAKPKPSSDLQIKGNLYKICAQILENFPTNMRELRNLRSVASIEHALGSIRTRYMEPLRINEVAAESGYRESNFCKVFKEITGETFHFALNKRRIEVACMLLRTGNDSVESIARQVGFGDAKSFCRVFKNRTGMTPNGYRKGGGV